MYIELKGVPGSGKSFVCNLLDQNLSAIKKDQFYSSNRKARVFSKIIKFIKIFHVLKLDFFRLFFLYYRSFHKKSENIFMFRCLLKNIEKYLQITNHNERFILLDEGITHPLTTLFLNKDKQYLYRFYEIITSNIFLRNIYENTVFIFLNTDNDLCFQRIKLRTQVIPTLYKGKSEVEIMKMLSIEKERLELEKFLIKNNIIEWDSGGLTNESNVLNIINEIIKIEKLLQKRGSYEL